MAQGRLEQVRLEAAVEQFSINLGLMDGWDGEPSYNSPEIWTMRGYLEKAESTEDGSLYERFAKAWAIVEEVTKRRIEDPQLSRSAAVLLKSHLLTQVAVTLGTSAIRTEVDQTKQYLTDSLIKSFCEGTVERGREIASLRVNSASGDDAQRQIGPVVTQQQADTDATVQKMLGVLIALRDSLPLLIDGVITEHKVFYATELAIREGFYEQMQNDLEVLFAEPFGVAVRQSGEEGLRRMERVLRDCRFLDPSEPFAPDLASLDPRWGDGALDERGG